MPRPTKLTRQLQAQMIAALREGGSYQNACALAGVNYRTFNRWMQRGEREADGPFWAFRSAILRAEAEAEVDMVAAWNNAMPDNWRAAAAFLERRYPERWGRRRAQIVMASQALAWSGSASETSRH